MINIMVAIPSYSGTVSLELMSRVMSLELPEGAIANFSYVSRCLIDKARNGMAAQCLMHNNDYILFIDDDQLCDRDVIPVFLDVMEKHGADIVGCPIPNRTGGKELAVFDFNYDKINDFTGTKEVGACGMATTLIKATALGKVIKEHEIPFEFLNLNYKDIITEFSEDVLFCKRARELGLKVWCTDKVKSIHFGKEVGFYYCDGEYKNTINNPL